MADGTGAGKSKRPRRSTAEVLAAGGKSRARPDAEVVMTAAQAAPLAATVRAHLSLLARARPVWTEERIAKACASMAEGIPYKIACLEAGATHQALSEVCERDAAVALQVGEARSAGKARLIREALADETGKSVNARTWLLERLDPELRVTHQVNQTITGPEGGAVHVTLSAADARALAK